MVGFGGGERRLFGSTARAQIRIWRELESLRGKEARRLKEIVRSAK